MDYTLLESIADPLTCSRLRLLPTPQVCLICLLVSTPMTDLLNCSRLRRLPVLPNPFICGFMNGYPNTFPLIKCAHIQKRRKSMFLETQSEKLQRDTQLYSGGGLLQGINVDFFVAVWQRSEHSLPACTHEQRPVAQPVWQLQKSFFVDLRDSNEEGKSPTDFPTRGARDVNT